ncbi:hypothetical protein [Variovorax gossypii]|uniref:hypothetical protein n=1 Tax=Variovorax gossypii TaxID=1679495 RepID=UPI001476966F|nr:hypothetical protein [Variovorax gossypii]
MAVVATVIALHGRPLRAADAAEAKPCRTPCLSANVPRERAEPPGAGKAEKAEKAEKADKAEEAPSRPKPVVARTRPQPVAPPPSAPPPVQREAAAAPRPAPSKRCSEINMRAAVGEPLSDQDMKTLRSQC